MSKRGRLGRDEIEYIDFNSGRLTIEEIAEKLDRTATAVREAMRKHVPPERSGLNLPKDEVAKLTIRKGLRNSLAWKQLHEEFDEDELKFFEERFIALVAQFKDDVLATEETQVFLLIKFEILMSRNLKERRRSRDDVARLEKTQAEFFKKNAGKMDSLSESQRIYSLNLETQLQSAKSAEQSRTSEFVKLEEKHQTLMKDLKGTRDQRISKIESSKQSFIGMLKALQDQDVRDHEGRQMELMKIAAAREARRLGEPHTYLDGNQDQPLLSAESVEALDGVGDGTQ